MSTPSQRQSYSPHWQAINAFACQVCGLQHVTEVDRIKADLAANTNKPAKAHQREEDSALVDQIDYLNKVECD